MASRDDSSLFGFDSDAWVERLRAARTAEEPGSLGPYEILGEVGRGGQGVVFRSRQPGTGRPIALKRLLAGSLASEAALRRFEREVEAAVAMSHPGIVTVYGVELIDGSPVLAMEWVEGVELTRWAEGRARAEILQVFLLVCDALQHAHQRGILHRDLKPSNVLVDEGGRPRVLDFGLAKLTTGSTPSVTSSGQFVGTPAYAAPEQVLGTDVDARADVYSLGAMLFEMLTGRRVIGGEGFSALAHAIGHEPPPRPSSVVSSIPAELDAIVLQAIARERERRYQSVDALSADVRRFLAGETVLAHPPGTWYLLRKLVARNRVAASLAILFVFATLVYAALASHQAGRLAEQRDKALSAATAESDARAAAEEQKRQAEEARAQAEREKQHAEDARTTAEREKQRAEDALAEAERERQRATKEVEATARVVEFLEGLFQAPDPEIAAGTVPSAKDLLDRGVQSIGASLNRDPLVLARLQRAMGRAYAALSEYDEAQPLLDAACATQRELLGEHDPDTLEALHDLAALYVEQGRYGEAESLQRQVAAGFEEVLGKSASKTLLARCSLAATLAYREDYQQALALLDGVLALADPETMKDVVLEACIEAGVAYKRSERYEDAERSYERALALARELWGEEHPKFSVLSNNLASLYGALGRHDKAEALYRSALEAMRRVYGDDHPNTLTTVNNLAFLLRTQRRFADAERLYEDGLALSRERLGPTHPFTLQVVQNLGVLRSNQGRHAEAVQLIEESLAGCRQTLGVSEPKTLSAEYNLAEALFDAGRLEEAESTYIECLQHMRQHLGVLDQRTLRCMNNFAFFLEKKGEHAAAIELYQEALSGRRSLMGESDPSTLNTLENIVFIYWRMERLDEAVELARELEQKTPQDSPLRKKREDMLAALLAGESVDGR